MKRSIIFLVVAAALVVAISGCNAPHRVAALRVATELVKEYPVTASPSEVTVKQLGVAGPADYEYLGNLLVYDPGDAVVVPLDSALNVARRAVSEAGGNYLYVMRLEAPGSLVRANYEIAGKILLAKGDKVLTSASPLYEPMVEPKKQ